MNPLAMLLVASLSLATGCSRDFGTPSTGGSAHMVVTQIPPRSGDVRLPDRLSPDERYPETSRIVLVPLEGEGDGVRSL